MNARIGLGLLLLMSAVPLAMTLAVTPAAAGEECASTVAGPSSQIGEHWAIAFGGSGDEYVYSIDEALDGGVIVGGYTDSFGAGSFDFWILRLASDGQVMWEKTYGAGGDDRIRAIRATGDGGYIAAGRTDSFGAGAEDVWIFKLEPDGAVAWQQTFGEADGDTAWTLDETSDGGYVFAERTHPDGVTNNELWVVKLDRGGAILWERSFGGPGDDRARSIHQTRNGGYIVAGWTTSFGAGSNDFWLLRLAANGNLLGQRTFGGPGVDKVRSVRQTSDGGYIVAGRTDSFGAGAEDVWVLKLDARGAVTWQNTYGGPGYENAWTVRQTLDGGYVLAGRTSSSGAGGNDLWLLKLNGDGSIAWQKTYGGPGDDRADSLELAEDGSYIVGGRTSSFGAGGYDLWVLRVDSNGDIAGCDVAGEGEAVALPSSVSALSASPQLRTTMTTVITTTALPNDTSAAGALVCSAPLLAAR